MLLLRLPTACSTDSQCRLFIKSVKQQPNLPSAQCGDSVVQTCDISELEDCEFPQPEAPQFLWDKKSLLKPKLSWNWRECRLESHSLTDWYVTSSRLIAIFPHRPREFDDCVLRVQFCEEIDNVSQFLPKVLKITASWVTICVGCQSSPVQFGPQSDEKIR